MKVSLARHFPPSPPPPYASSCRNFFSPPPLPSDMLPPLHRIHSDLSLHFSHSSSLPSSSLHPSSSDCHLSDRLPPRTVSHRQTATPPHAFCQEEPRAALTERVAQLHSHAVDDPALGDCRDSTKLVPSVPSGGEQLHPQRTSAPHVKLMCSFGGKIIPRPADGKLRYVGGETRIVTVTRGVSLSEFMLTMVQHYGLPLGFKYQLPNEDLDALISVSSDDDFENMMEEHEKAEISRSRIRLFFFSFLRELEVHGTNSKTEAEDGRSCLEHEYVKAINGPSKVICKNTSDDDVGASSQVDGSENGEICGRLSCESVVNVMKHANAPSTSSFAQPPYKPAIMGDISLQRLKEQLNRVKVDAHGFEGEPDRSDGSACSSNASDSLLQHQEQKFFIAVDAPRDGDHDPSARHIRRLYQCAHHLGDDKGQHFFLGSESPTTVDNLGISVPRVENWQCMSHIEQKMPHFSHCMIGNTNKDNWHRSVQQQQLQQVDMNSWNIGAQSQCYGIHKQPQVSDQLHPGQAAHRFLNRSVSFQDIRCWNTERGTHLCGLRNHAQILHQPHGNYIGSAPCSPRLGVVDIPPSKCSCGLQHSQAQRCINVDQVCNKWPLEFGDLPIRKNGHGCSVSRFCDNASNQLNAQFVQKPMTLAAEIDHRDHLLYNLKPRNSRYSRMSEYQARQNIFNHSHLSHAQDELSHVSYETNHQCLCNGHLHQRQDMGCYRLQNDTSTLPFSKVPICNEENSEDATSGKYVGHDHGVLDDGLSCAEKSFNPEGRMIRHPISSAAFQSPHLGQKGHSKIASMDVLEGSSAVMNTEAAVNCVEDSCCFAQQSMNNMIGINDLLPAGKHIGGRKECSHAETPQVSDYDSCILNSIRFENCEIRSAVHEESVDESWEGFPVTSSISTGRFSIAHGKTHLLSPDVIPLGSVAETASVPIMCELRTTCDSTARSPKLTAVASPLDSSSLDSINITASCMSGSLESSKVELNPEMFASNMSDTELLADGMVSFILDSSSNCGFLEGNQVSDSIMEMDAEQTSVDKRDEIGTGRDKEKYNEDSMLIVSSTSNGWLKVGVEKDALAKEDCIVEEIGIHENYIAKDTKNTKEIKEPEAEVEAVALGLQIIRNSDLEDMKELGAGTFGTVYHGKWRGSDVAIKRIRASCFSNEPLQRERLLADFWKEARTLGQLHHPNVVAFYGVVPDGPGGTLATVTEYMVNGSLKQVLQKQDRTIDRRKRLFIAMDAAFGMEYLHSKSIVHFDLKCENLLVNMRDAHRPICKVGDLGLSKIKHQTLVSGGVRGTLPWMAPELLSGNGSKVTEKVDVFSFGIVMWELLTGEEPYGKMHCGTIIGGILNNTLRPTIPSWCDPGWRNLMERCWSGDPVERPSFSDIATELRAIAASMNVK